MSDELAVHEKYEFMKKEQDSIVDIVRANVGDTDLSASILDVIRWPTGGMTQWEVPDLMDDQRIEKELHGIIVHHHTARAYWSEDIDEGGSGQPPDCRSDDGVIGQGDPGIHCNECELAEFGPDGEAPPCKVMKMVYFMTEDDLIPLILRVPPTSKSIFEKYLMRLARKGIPYWGVESVLSLQKAQSGDGFDYAELRCNVGQRLDPEEIEVTKKWSDMMDDLLQTQGVVDHTEGVREEN